MRPAATLFTGMAGLVCLGFLLKMAPVPQSTIFSVADRAGTEIGVSLARPPVIERRLVRGIAPERFASPLADTSVGLERIEPRQPATQTSTSPRVAMVMFPRPKSLEAGLLQVSAGPIKLAGITPTPVARKCLDPDGRQWPCGMVALSQQRLFIRNRTLTCAGTATSWSGTAITDCSLGNVDLAEWLVTHGWVEAQGDGRLMALTRAAKAEKRGLWGLDPRNRREEAPVSPPWP